MSEASQTILVVEDGDEYMDVLSRFVGGYRYIQTHDGSAALAVLRSEEIAAVYLDMRFDRVPHEVLLGDIQKVSDKFSGDRERAWKFLEKNQGLYILNHLCGNGYSHIPMVLSHDFSAQSARWQHLSNTHKNLSWLSDTVAPLDIKRHFENILAT